MQNPTKINEVRCLLNWCFVLRRFVWTPKLHIWQPCHKTSAKSLIFFGSKSKSVCNFLLSPSKIFSWFVWSLRMQFLQICMKLFSKSSIFLLEVRRFLQIHFYCWEATSFLKNVLWTRKMGFWQPCLYFSLILFFVSKSENMNYFYFQKSTVLPQKFPLQAYNTICQLYRKAFTQKSEIFPLKVQKIYETIDFRKKILEVSLHA